MEKTNVENGRTLDRRVKFDERSRSFRAVDLISHKLLRSYTWACDAFHDQGMEGACVGFAWAHELTARPAVLPTSEAMARGIYQTARTLDPWPGEDYDGTSVLAGVKAIRQMYDPGFIESFRWAFGLEDLVRVLGYKGPAVLGINWYEGMFNVDPDGFVHVNGDIAGGHAILARGVKLIWNRGGNPNQRTFADVNLDKSFITLRNSWGKAWGVEGDCKISLMDMGRLLSEQGEACVPVIRGVV